MPDPDLVEQLKPVFASLKSAFRLTLSAANHPAREELLDLVQGLTAASPKITLAEDEARGPALSLERAGAPLPVRFRGVPGGHEFTTLVLAILNADGLGRLPDPAVQARIRALKGPAHLTVYVSAECTNCPDVAQALNLIALLNPALSVEIVEGTWFADELAQRKVQAVPTVYLGEELLHVGKASLATLLDLLETRLGASPITETLPPQECDVAVLGGGPAGAAAAIYAARKGLKTLLIAERIGGQVNETQAIENLISVPHTEGARLANDLRTHLQAYPVTLLEDRTVEALEEGPRKTLRLKGGERITASAVIVATGARWRRLGIPGEAEAIGRGVAFCPHCDGPFYKGKRVIVVGGGNSGVEAAIDLAGICAHVTLLEFLPQLKADDVLQQSLRALPNVEVHTNVASKRVLEADGKVRGLEVEDRATGNISEVLADGIFVQIGLLPNSGLLEGIAALSDRKEVIIDATCRTNVPGLYAAGDVTTVPYKQIVIAMGEGAKASLSAFEDFARGLLTRL